MMTDEIRRIQTALGFGGFCEDVRTFEEKRSVLRGIGKDNVEIWEVLAEKVEDDDVKKIAAEEIERISRLA